MTEGQLASVQIGTRMTQLHKKCNMELLRVIIVTCNKLNPIKTNNLKKTENRKINLI